MTNSAVLSAKVRVNPEILSHYQDVMGGNQFFQTWFAEMQTKHRFVMTNTAQLVPTQIRSQPQDTQAYAVASYFAGGYLFVPESMRNDQWILSLISVGIRIFTHSGGLPHPMPGDNPIESIKLDANSGHDVDVLDGYVALEDEIVVYDKYINQPGLDLLKHIAAGLSPGSSIYVYTTSVNNTRRQLRPTVAQIESSLKACNPRITCACQEVSVSFRKQTHDRYIFCGHRLQIVFTAGIDAIGALNSSTGRRVNKMSEILVYTAEASRPLQIEDDAGNSRTVYAS